MSALAVTDVTVVRCEGKGAPVKGCPCPFCVDKPEPDTEEET